MALIEGSNAWKFSLRFDMHRWGGEDPCKTCGEGVTHPNTCLDCGIKRSHWMENGAFEYTLYQHPGERYTHEVIPRCGDKVPDPSVAILDTVQICDRCGHFVEGEGDAARCRYNCKKARGSDEPAAIKKLLTVRRLREE